MTSLLPPDNDASGATFSVCGLYRYCLWRRIGPGARLVVWIMLNPSTADALADDPTIRRCLAFSKKWGFARVEIVNLFAFRATDPRDMKAAFDPMGPDNNMSIILAASRAELVVAAWGVHGDHLGRAQTMAAGIANEGTNLHALGTTKDGHPKHPLYLRADSKPSPWNYPEDR